MTHTDAATRFWSLSQAIRRSAPLVHNITNMVVLNDTADAIAAVGATQITLHTLEEARDAAAVSAALAVNPGTLNEAWLGCAHAALDVAEAAGKPWVLDPVAAGLTGYRTAAAQALLERGPAVLKANASEVLALAEAGEGGRGADSVHSVEDATVAARTLARRYRCVVVVTGARDLITDGERTLRMDNGHPLLAAMIGGGCMLTSVTACYLAVADTAFEAAQAALAHFAVAAELAAARADGPGTLKPLLLDALYGLTAEQFTARLRLVEA